MKVTKILVTTIATSLMAASAMAACPPDQAMNNAVKAANKAFAKKLIKGEKLTSGGTAEFQKSSKTGESWLIPIQSSFGSDSQFLKGVQKYKVILNGGTCKVMGDLKPFGHADNG